MPELIDIRHERTCQCRRGNLSCLSAKNWVKCQLSVWHFNYDDRDFRDKFSHPATFPIALPIKVMELLTHKGELVLDPFVGSGTTLVAASSIGRNGIGFDLNPEYAKIARERIPPPNMFDITKQAVVNADAMTAPGVVAPGTVKLIMTSPPYANQLNRKRAAKSVQSINRGSETYRVGRVEQYSQDPRDLGTMPPGPFEDAMTSLFSRLEPLLTPDGQVVVNVGDMYFDGVSHPLHAGVIRSLMAAGLEYRNTIIWDKMNLIHRTGIFGYPSNFVAIGGSFEYILHFRKRKQ